MKIVIVESPFAGEIADNIRYARRALAHCLERKEAPYASHLLYPEVLDDLDPEQRTLGIEAGYAFWKCADVIAFYVDRGYSKGMLAALDRARSEGRYVEIRKIGLSSDADT